MASVCLLFLVCYLTFSTTIELSQAHPMRGLNVRDATSSDNLSFVVSLGRINRGGKHFCTGSLITRRSVLTCQHCIEGKNKSNIIITIGSTDLRSGQKYRVDDWQSYDQWNFNISDLEFSTEDDIAIIRLDRRVDNPEVIPASINYNVIQHYTNSLLRLRIAGWGLVDNGTQPLIMKTGLVNSISSQKCIERGKNINVDAYFYVPKHFFCSAADPWLLADCGDSGGPTLNENNQLVALLTAVCPSKLYYSYFSPEFRDNNLMNIHLNLFTYKGFIDAVAIL